MSDKTAARKSKNCLVNTKILPAYLQSPPSQIQTAWRLIKLSALLLAWTPSVTLAAPTCSPAGETIPFQSSLASAGYFANFRNSESSVNFQTDALLSAASQKRSEIEGEHPLCVDSCSNARLAIVFSSTPNMRRSGYDDAADCDRLDAETAKNPITYSGRTFENADDARSWYHELTQGDGTDGEDLYTRCPGSCSPAYTSSIIREDERLVISTSIHCGHARDRDDNQYRLATGFRWECL